jgi:predicted PurR-regulated permease PerM
MVGETTLCQRDWSCAETVSLRDAVDAPSAGLLSSMPPARRRCRALDCFTLMNSIDNDQNRNGSRLMTNGGWLSRERGLALVLIVATALAFYVCYRLAHPFLPAITWALALAVVAYPLHNWIAGRIKRSNLAAGLAVTIVAVAIVAPGVFMAQHLVSRASRGVETLKTQADPGQWRTTIESNPQLARVLGWIEPHLDVRSVTERAANAVASRLSSFVGGSLWVVAQLLITFFTLFYLFRDRRTTLRTVRSFVPLSQSETDRLFSRVSDTIYATVYGTFAVSLVQGVLGGLMFWWLGLPEPVLWGTMMTLLSLIPVLGAPVVWIPAAIFLALMGSWGKALILTGWGLIVIGSIDNLLYPILVGDKVRMHTLLVFFSVVGGLALFGVAGLVLGPVAVVITNVLVEVWRQRTSGGRTVEDGVNG